MVLYLDVLSLKIMQLVHQMSLFLLKFLNVFGLLGSIGLVCCYRCLLAGFNGVESQLKLVVLLLKGLVFFDIIGQLLLVVS